MQEECYVGGKGISLGTFVSRNLKEFSCTMALGELAIIV